MGTQGCCKGRERKVVITACTASYMQVNDVHCNNMVECNLGMHIIAVTPRGENDGKADLDLHNDQVKCGKLASWDVNEEMANCVN